MNIKLNKFRYRNFKKAVDLIDNSSNNIYLYWWYAGELNRIKIKEGKLHEAQAIYNRIVTKFIPSYYI